MDKDIDRKCCDTCKYYKWYYDKCSKYNCETDARARCSEYEHISKLILCKDCKYFEYDSVAQVDGIPLIVTHEICKKWGEGCKTNENGYCFLAEPKGEKE